MKSYQSFLERKASKYGNGFDPSELAPQFIPYFENEKRIEVEFSYGERKRGTVGVTTGWRPVFILMLTKRSRGSSWTLGKADKIIKIIQ